jgi:hypothetical protein
MSNSGSNLDRTICYGTLIFFVILMLRGVQAEYQASKARKAEREAWEKGCKTASLVIVRRSPALSWWDDSAYRPMRTPDSLELEMNSDQKVASPTQTTVYVNVSPHVYKHLEKSSTVRIYYMPESPLTFLLEDEL